MTDSIRYVRGVPTLDEFKNLRDAVDWNLEQKGINDERAQISLLSSAWAVRAYDGEKIIGMVRASGDRGMYANIQDTIVLPGYQGRGVGSRMMELLLEEITPLKGFLLGVCPSKVSVEFYSKLGFKKRPEHPNGYMYIEMGKSQ